MTAQTLPLSRRQEVAMPETPHPDPTPPAVLQLSAGPFPGLPVFGNRAQDLPLYGLTVLAVEDSRYTSDALRLMCRRAGARLRRAETMLAARAHLRVYRPDVVLVDLGLPDGRGEALIRELVMARNRPAVVLGTSGNPDGRAPALAAGADDFIEKPLETVAALCRALRPHLPEFDIHPPHATPAQMPDALAFQDDLTYAALALQGDPGHDRQAYVSGFLRGLARHAHDSALETAAIRASGSAQGVDQLRHLIAARLQPDAAFTKA